MPNKRDRAGKSYKDMERLHVGKTFEKARHHFDFIADFKSHLQSQDLDAWDHGAWGYFSTHLQCKMCNKKHRNRNLDQNKQWHTLLTQIYKQKLKLGP